MRSINSAAEAAESRTAAQENGGRRSVESTPQSGRRVGGGGGHPLVHSPEEFSKIRHSRQRCPAISCTLVGEKIVTRNPPRWTIMN
jgi:hypothetical protein